MTDNMVDKVAKSDAEFDGRSWLGMPAAERQLYLARAERSVAIVIDAQAEGRRGAQAIIDDMKVRREASRAAERPVWRI